MKRLSKVMTARRNEFGGAGGDSMGGEGASCMDEETGRRYSCNEATQYSLVTSTGVHVYVCTLYLYYIYDIHIYLYL